MPASLRRLVAVLVALAVAALALAQATGALTPQRFDAITKMSREDQRADDVQRDVVSFARQGALVYLHHLDGLAPRHLFSLGDEARFTAALGSADGTDHNRIFIEGTGAPTHVDGGEYVLPTDLLVRYPPEPTRNTYWHEAQHALLDAAGTGVDPSPYGHSLDNATDADEHHAFIEGVGQRGAQAYGFLTEFEVVARRAQAEQREIEKTRTPTFAELRHLWSEPHQQFSRFTKAWERVARMPPEVLGSYRDATGITFAPPETVATFYRDGGLKEGGAGGANVGGDVLPPKWVFYPTLVRMPVWIDVVEEPGAPPGADHRLERTFSITPRARGSMHERDVRPGLYRTDLVRLLREGTLSVRLEGGDPQAIVLVSLPKGSPKKVSSRAWDVPLNAEVVAVTFVVPDLQRTTEPTTYTIHLDFADDTKPALFDTAERRIEIRVDPPPPAPSAATTPKPASPRATSAPPDPRAYRGYWKLTGIEPANWSGQMTGDVQNPTDEPRRVRYRVEMMPPHRKATCAATYTWTDPNARYAAGEAFTIGIHAALDEYAFHHDPRIWGDTPEKKPGTCKRTAGLSAGLASEGGEVFFDVVFKEDGSIQQLSDQRTLSGVFPAPQVAHDGRRVGRVDLYFYVDKGAWVAYRYEWVDEGPEEARVEVTIPDPPSAPVPPPYDDAPIEIEELTGPRPPVAPPPGEVPRRVKPTEFQPPGGDYRVTLPAGWTPLAYVDGEYLFVSPHGAWVIACPPRSYRYRGTFADQRSRLAGELIRREIGGNATTPRFGPHEGLVATLAEPGRTTTHVFVASEERAVAFRVVAGPGVAPGLPTSLEQAFPTVAWTAGGPAVRPR